MLLHSFLNDLSDILEGMSQLLHFVVAERNVISELTVISSCIHGVVKLSSRLFIFAFFIKDASLIDHDVGILLVSLPE